MTQKMFLSGPHLKKSWKKKDLRYTYISEEEPLYKNVQKLYNSSWGEINFSLFGLEGGKVELRLNLGISVGERYKMHDTNLLNLSW